MFPFRPPRAATALLELAEAMLAPDAFAQLAGDDASNPGERDRTAMRHPHRRGAAIEHRRRPSPPQPEQECLAPLTRAGRTRDAQTREAQRTA